VQDLDDAISIERVTLGDGRDGYRVGVHVADVGHFVEAKSDLDEEARRRTTTIYFDNKLATALRDYISSQ
jgi:exoribonuclease R